MLNLKLGWNQLMKGFKLLSWMTCASDRLNIQGTLTPNETENIEKT